MTRKRLSQEERRRQIINVAIAHFASKGFKGATTRAIASAAGVSEAIIFRHFATKEDLYDAIINFTVDRRLKVWEQEDNPNRTDDLETLLHQFACFYIQRNRKDPTFIRLMMYSALEDHKFREKFFAIYTSPRMKAIRRAIEEGIVQGRYRNVDVQLTLRSFFWALLHYCISRFIASHETVGRSEDRRMIDNLVQIFMEALTLPHHPSDVAPER